MNAQKVDVLAVLDRQMEFTVASDYPGASDDHRDMLAARDAVAELIAADQEYDAARADAERYAKKLDGAQPPLNEVMDRITRVRVATARRATALARVGGAA